MRWKRRITRKSQLAPHYKETDLALLTAHLRIVAHLTGAVFCPKCGLFLDIDASHLDGESGPRCNHGHDPDKPRVHPTSRVELYWGYQRCRQK